MTPETPIQRDVAHRLCGRRVQPHPTASYAWCPECDVLVEFCTECGQREVPSEDDMCGPWQWVGIGSEESAHVTYVRGACNHLELQPVISVEGIEVARLCLTCDQQLPAAHLK